MDMNVFAVMKQGRGTASFGVLLVEHLLSLLPARLLVTQQSGDVING